MLIAIAIVLGTSSAICRAQDLGGKQKPSDDSSSTSSIANPEKPQLGGAVSLVALIANPERYNGKRVIVEGYATLGFENDFLYLTQYDAQFFVVNNALWLALTKDQLKKWQKFDHQPVLIEGTFDFPKTGSYWACPNGAITKIEKLEAGYQFLPGVVPRN